MTHPRRPRNMTHPRGPRNMKHPRAPRNMKHPRGPRNMKHPGVDFPLSPPLRVSESLCEAGTGFQGQTYPHKPVKPTRQPSYLTNNPKKVVQNVL